MFPMLVSLTFYIIAFLEFFLNETFSKLGMVTVISQQAVDNSLQAINGDTSIS